MVIWASDTKGISVANISSAPTRRLFSSSSLVVTVHSDGQRINHKDTKTQREPYRMEAGAHPRVRPSPGRHIGLLLLGLLIKFTVPLIGDAINRIDFFVPW